MKKTMRCYDEVLRLRLQNIGTSWTITAELRNMGHAVSYKRVLRIMRQEKSFAISKENLAPFKEKMLGEHSSDLHFPRARAPEYSAERGRAYLLSSERVQESPRRSGRYARIHGPDSNR